MSLKILAVDSSGDACSVACCNRADVATDFSLGSAAVAEEFAIAPYKHSLFILDFVKSTLAAQNLSLAELDVIAFTCGPGSFTGARLAASVVQGLAMVHNLPVVAISTLQAIAQGAYMEYGATHALIAVDARTQEIYWGEYQLSKKPKCTECMEAMVDDQLIKPEHLLISPGMREAVQNESRMRPAQVELCGAAAGSVVCLGNGWSVYQEILNKHCMGANGGVEQLYPNIYPRARYVAQLGVRAYALGMTVSAQEVAPVYLRNDIVRSNA